MRQKAIPAKVRALVEARSEGICEGCREARATEMHHRKFLTRGGKHEVSNLLHLCGWGNHTGCHGIAHSGKRGEELGWAISSGTTPEFSPLHTPYTDLDGRMWFLLADGTRQECVSPMF